MVSIHMFRSTRSDNSEQRIRIYALVCDSFNKRNMIAHFPLHQFKLSLSKNSKIKASLQPFLLQFNKNNMQWIFGAINELYNNLHNPKVEITTTFNSLFAIKFILDSANVVVVQCIESYLLPIITTIASYQIQNNNEKRGESYFISKGFTGNRDELKKSGYNFVHIAEEIIKSSAQIKPKALCFNEEIQQPSDFVQALSELRKKGLQTYKSFMFYEVSILKETRIAFLKSLQRYHKEIAPFKLFYENFAKQYLSKGVEAKGNVSPFKLLEKGEATAIQAVVRECIKSLKSADLSERTRALRLMSDLVRWGDITVAYQINSQGTISELVREVADPKEKSLGFQRAAKVLKKYQNNEQQKIQYYKELLKSIRLWAKCYSTAINSIDRVSNVKFFCGTIQRLGIQFPEYENIFADQALYESNKSKKQKMNQKLTLRLQKKQNERRLSIISSYIDLASPTLPDSRPLLEKVSSQIEKVRKILSNICQSEDRMPENIQTLTKFYKQFDANIHRGKFGCKDLYLLITQGMPLMDGIEQIMPLLQQFKSKSITFDTLKASISLQPFNLARSQERLRASSFTYQLPANSYRPNQLPQPKIDMTTSQVYSTGQIIRKKYTQLQDSPKKKSEQNGLNEEAFMNKFKQYRETVQRRCSINPDLFLNDLNIDEMANSIPQVGKNPNCMQMNKLETKQQFKEFEATTLKNLGARETSRFA